MKASQKAKPTPLIVTTVHKGVFFGYGDATTTAETIRITDARMCVYWSEDVKGIVGLAANGPTKSCKIGPAAPAITLQGVTSIMEVTKIAEEKWQEAPWN